MQLCVHWLVIQQRQTSDGPSEPIQKKCAQTEIEESPTLQSSFMMHIGAAVGTSAAQPNLRTRCVPYTYRMHVQAGILYVQRMSCRLARTSWLRPHFQIAVSLYYSQLRTKHTPEHVYTHVHRSRVLPYFRAGIELRRAGSVYVHTTERMLIASLAHVQCTSNTGTATSSFN